MRGRKSENELYEEEQSINVSEFGDSKETYYRDEWLKSKKGRKVVNRVSERESSGSHASQK